MKTHNCDRCGGELNGVDQGEVWLPESQGGGHFRYCHGVEGRDDCYFEATVTDSQPDFDINEIDPGLLGALNRMSDDLGVPRLEDAPEFSEEK